MSEDLKRDRAAPRGAVPSDSSAAESRIAARTRELDLIQTLGRLAAEAQTPAELFRATVSAVQQAEALDLAVVASELDGVREVTCFLARPFASGCLRRLITHAGRLSHWGAGSEPAPVIEWRLDDFDSSRGARSDYREQDLVVVPVLRRNAQVACLVFLPAVRADEAQLRLLYSATNQLSVHVDRILTVRETEAQRFRQILDSMPQAVFLTDAQLRMLQHNRSAADLLDRMGLEATAGFDPLVSRLGLGPWIERVARSSNPVVDAEARDPGGAILSVSISPLPATGRDGDDLVVVLADVTDSRRMQQQLAQTEKMSSLGQMIAGTAHELNNPLSSVLGNVQLMRATAANRDEKLSRRLELLEREAERCQRIVQNLLAFARQRRPQREPLSFNQVVQSVLALMDYQLRTSGVNVSSQLDRELPSLEGDMHQLQQVLVNLLTNAQQAIRQQADQGEILVVTRPAEADGIVLEVHDSGPGISEEIRSRIFDPFFTTKEEGKGTGLGLSIVYGIVASHGGEIEARSSARGGACFRVFLPLGGDANGAAGEAGTVHVPRPSRPGRVLVVDDEQPLAQMICEALGRDGHDAVAVGDGHAALERLAEEEYDLIVSDVKMPGMDARRLVAELGRRHPGISKRVLLTSGDTVSGEPEAFAGAEGLELLHKPFDLDDLIHRVRRHLSAATGEDC